MNLLLPFLLTKAKYKVFCFLSHWLSVRITWASQWCHNLYLDSSYNCAASHQECSFLPKRGSRTRDDPHETDHQKYPNFPKKCCQRKQKRKTVILLWEFQASSKLKLQVYWKAVGDFMYKIRRLLIVLSQIGLQPSLNCGILLYELFSMALWLLPISHLHYYQRIYVMLWPHPLDYFFCPKGTHMLTHDFLILSFDLLVPLV